MNKRINVIIHLLFWILPVSLSVLNILKENMFAYYFLRLITAAFFHAIVFYCFYFFLTPKFLLKKQTVLFLLTGFCFIVVYCIPVTVAYSKILEFWYFLFSGKSSEPSKLIYLYPSVLYSHFLYSVFGSLFRVAIDWIKNRERQNELEKQNITNELALLRSQINPHFLFNTLNNIHSFVYREPDKTSFGIIKLSEIMRYMLYESDSKKVLIEKEIQHIENYIELQKLRYNTPDFVRFSIDNDNSVTMLPPLLLITFVENAFKHSKKKGVMPCITIHLKISNNSIVFEVDNYIKQNETVENQASGFGLKNVKRRLELIYPDLHSLEISQKEDKFKVKLVIENAGNC